MHFLSLTVVLLLIVIHTPSVATCETTPDPRAFVLEAVDDVQWLPNGLLLVTYRDPHSGRPSHATLHHVLAVLPVPAEAAFASSRVGITLFTTNGADSGVTYAVMTHPLFYGDQLASDGFPQRLWEDPDEDGLNGNEIAFSNPAAHRDDGNENVPDT